MTVFTDSRPEPNFQASVKTLREAELDLPIWYAGMSEKANFAKELAGKGDIPPEVINFALFGSEWSTRTTGANRNSILCQTVGSMALCVDDDTLCSPHVVHGTVQSLSLGQHRSPSELWCFEDRAHALEFGEPAPIDVIGGHERFLGRTVGGVLSEQTSHEKQKSLDHMCGHLLLSVLARRGRIRATYNGARGDSGFHSDIGLVAHRSPQTRQRVQRLGSRYRQVLRSRQVVRQSLSPAISHPETADVGMFMGLDNTVPLPPFMPDGRNQDGVFAKMLGRFSEHHFIAHLPFTLGHEPIESRAYAANRDTTIRMADVISACLSKWNPETGNDEPMSRALSFGRYLSHLSGLPPAEFEEFMAILLYERCVVRVRALERLLTEDCGVGGPWAEDVNNRLEGLRCLTDHESCFALIDLQDHGSTPRSHDVQRILGDFGRLLEWWPAIVERVIQLQSNGINIARIL